MELASTLVSCGPLNVALCLHTRARVPANEWQLALAHFRQLRTAGALDPARARMLVVSDGGAPDSKQRGELSDLWQGKPIKVAVLVPGMGSPVKRGVMTALTWINPAVAYFMSSELQAALSHLDLGAEQERLWNELRALQVRLPPVRMLRQIAERCELPWDDAPRALPPD